MTHQEMILNAVEEYIRKGAWKTADRELHKLMKDPYDFESEYVEEKARELQSLITANSALTYEQLMDLALKNYNKGGDSTYECWDEGDYAEHGPMSKYEALRMFERDLDIANDMMGW